MMLTWRTWYRWDDQVWVDNNNKGDNNDEAGGSDGDDDDDGDGDDDDDGGDDDDDLTWYWEISEGSYRRGQWREELQ